MPGVSGVTVAHYAHNYICRGRIGARHSPRPLIGGHEENSSNARTNAAARLICMSGGPRRASADKNRNGGDVLVICPTCQNVVTGSLKASMPAALFYFAWGCFRYFRFRRVGKGAPWRRAHHASSSEMVGTLSPSAFALRATAEALPTLRSYLIVIPCVLNLM